MVDLTEALRFFDATEANLKRLQELWAEIERLIPAGLVIESGSPNAVEYDELCRSFRHVHQAMPKLDGFELTNEIMDLDDICKSRFEALELGEPFVEVDTERQIYKQGEVLREYRFRFTAQRRRLVRSAMQRAIREVDQLLSELAPSEDQEPSDKVSHPAWEAFKQKVREIDVLRGSSVQAPPRWDDLRRHIGFGMVCDLRDIIQFDWPAAKPALESAMYGPADPIPVGVADLAALVAAAPTGPVITALNWSALTAESFERLLFNLVARADGYTNPTWLMHTNAPDRGRDLSVSRVTSDPLTGTRTERVIVQCKHWQSKGVKVSDVASLVASMRLWEPPRVDELIIATTGQFTADAVAWVEKRNLEREIPAVTMWPDKHLEALLAERPHLVAEFGLR